MEEIDKGTPLVGMRFRDVDEAWEFWEAYGGRTGFDVRRRYANKSRLDGQVGSCRFVCSNEGHRRKGLTDHAPKRFRAETRTNCQARMCFQLDREAGNYEVTEVVLEHNHLLQLPQTCHLMISQRKISERQAFEIEAADDSGIMPTLPTHYVLKRWTREARNGSIQDRQGRKVVENPKLEAQPWSKDMSYKFHDMTYKIANSPECHLLLENALDRLWPQLEDKLSASATSAANGSSNDQENVDPNVQQVNDLLSSAKLKQKEVSSKNFRRKVPWYEKLRKGRKPTKSVPKTKNGAKQQQHNKKDSVQSQVQVENDDTKKRGSPIGASLKRQEYDAIDSFTALLTTSRVDDSYLYDELI